MFRWPRPVRRRHRPPARSLLNLGCGDRRHDDWVNTDLVPVAADVLAVDLRKPLPFPDGSFEGVYASHVLEHLAPIEALALLRECRRVLRPEGTVRVVVPDLERIARDYLASFDQASATSDPEARWRHRWMTVELLDQLVRTRCGGVMRRWWSCDPPPCRDFVERRVGAEAARSVARLAAERRRNQAAAVRPEQILFDDPPSARETARFASRGERHRWMYDRLSLADLLDTVGFLEARRVGPTESHIPRFATFGLDADPDGRPLKPDSLFMEATCPVT